MKTLIVYYSRTKTTEKVALKLAGIITAKTVKLIDQKDRRGVIGYLASGRDALKKTLANINDIKVTIEDYDLVILATPVWVGTMVPAIRTFISNNKGKFKNVAFLTTQSRTKRQKVFDNLKTLAGIKPLSEAMFITRDVAQDKYKDGLNTFVAKLSLQN